MEKRSRRRIRDLVALSASQGLSQNEIGCARISMMARSTNASFTGRIQKRKTYPLHYSHPACNTRPVHTQGAKVALAIPWDHGQRSHLIARCRSSHQPSAVRTPSLGSLPWYRPPENGKAEADIRNSRRYCGRSELSAGRVAALQVRAATSMGVETKELSDCDAQEEDNKRQSHERRHGGASRRSFATTLRRDHAE